MVLKIWAGNSKKPTIRLYKLGGRRFISKVVPNSFKKAYVSVSYGKKLCNFNCLCEFSNEAEATTKPAFLKLIRDFMEK